MTRTRALTLSAVASALALTAAACGYTAPTGGAGGYSYAAASPASPPTASTATVTSAALGPGTALVDGTGRALYLFANDTGSTSTCSGTCASVWPPLPAPADLTAATGTGLDNQVGSTSRSDGSAQLTYHGHPLYYYAGDDNPGDTRGQGLYQFGAHWYLVQPDGAALDNDWSSIYREDPAHTRRRAAPRRETPALLHHQERAAAQHSPAAAPALANAAFNPFPRNANPPGDLRDRRRLRQSFPPAAGQSLTQARTVPRIFAYSSSC